LGEYEQAAYLMQQSLELMRAVGDQHFLAMYLSVFSGVASALGKLSEAKQLLRESLAISRALGDRWIAAFSLNQLGLVTYLMGNTEWAEAKRLYQEGLAISKELGDQWNISLSLNHLGQITYALDELQEAKQYFLTALKTAMEAQATTIALDALVGLVILLVKERASTAESEVAKKEQALEWLVLPLNHPASWQDTKNRANQLLAELEAELPPHIVAAAQQRGQARKLKEIVAEILAEKGGE
jgi:tetratricopeptide (TPR) repeat protein